ncbi:MAG: cysteine synthase family protein [Chloroflexota bacterium]
MENLLTSAIEAIGKTPLVELGRITQGINGRILAKLDYLNPGFSKKDRIGRQMIEDAEADDSLQPGQTVVELTSGNTGTGLAIVCAVKGYPFVAVMSKGNSTERARMMQALGAEVVLVDQLPDSVPGQVSGADLALVEEVAQKIVAERNAFRADQFNLTSNIRAHALHTAPEIWQQSGENIDVFCDFVGSGGTFAGCAQFFKSLSKPVACYIIEPDGAAALAGQPITQPDHRIQGGGYSMPNLALINHNHVDSYLTVNDAEAMQMARRLAKEEGIFGGFSAGANVAVALRLLQTAHVGSTIAVLICDSGLKYLSTDLWEDF